MLTNGDCEYTMKVTLLYYESCLDCAIVCFHAASKDVSSYKWMLCFLGDCRPLNRGCPSFRDTCPLFRGCPSFRDTCPLFRGCPSFRDTCCPLFRDTCCPLFRDTCCPLFRDTCCPLFRDTCCPLFRGCPLLRGFLYSEAALY